MKTPAQYQHEIAGLNLEAIPSSASTGEDAGKTLSLVAEAQEKLKQIEIGLNYDIHALRSQYHGREAALNSMAQRRIGGKNKAEEEQRIQEERESKIGPYEEIRKLINEQLARLDEIKSELEGSKPKPA